MLTLDKRLQKWVAWICVLLLPLLAGCRPDPVMLSMVGFNYTGRFTEYSVHGAGGGDAGNGGSIVCCVLYRPDRKPPFTVKVKWTLEDIRDFEHGGWIPAEPEEHEAIVEINGPIPKNPKVFETHFLPNGSVKAYINDVIGDPYYTPDGKPLRPMPGSMRESNVQGI